MEKFTASNGASIVRCGDGATLAHPEWNEYRLYPDHMNAMCEYFQHVRDAELGLWRWPEDPRYIVKQADQYSVAVMNEAEFWKRSGAALGPRDLIHFRDARDCQTEKPLSDSASGYKRAAWAFWQAHPELCPKPWFSAKPDEMWVLNFGGKDVAVQVMDYVNEGVVFMDHSGETQFERDDPSITAARRIWPESHHE